MVHFLLYRALSPATPSEIRMLKVSKPPTKIRSGSSVQSHEQKNRRKRAFHNFSLVIWQYSSPHSSSCRCHIQHHKRPTWPGGLFVMARPGAALSFARGPAPHRHVANASVHIAQLVVLAVLHQIAPDVPHSTPADTTTDVETARGFEPRHIKRIRSATAEFLPSIK